MTFNGIHKSYTNCDSYTFKQIEIPMDRPNYIGFALLDWSKLLMYETYYDELQPFFDREKSHLPYMDCDSFVINFKASKIVSDLIYLVYLFDFINMDENHELFSKKNKKFVEKYKIETPKIAWVNEFVCLKIQVFLKIER